MTEILLSSQVISQGYIEKNIGIPLNNVSGIDDKVPKIISPYHPYLLSENPSSVDRMILARLGSVPDISGLGALSQMIGPENLLPLAEVHQKLVKAKLHERMPGERHHGESALSSADITGGILLKHNDKFTRAALEYKKTLLDYRKAFKSGDSHASSLARTKAQSAFKELQKNYRAEMKIMQFRSSTRKIKPLKNIESALHEARVKRGVMSKLDVEDMIEASKLGKLAKNIKLIGNGIVALNLYEGTDKVVKTYQHGGDWEREMTKQSLSIAADVEIGEAAAEVGAFLLAATPVGWVGLLITGVVIAGTAIAGVKASGLANRGIGAATDSLFDKISQWAKSL